jgi:hypothetical protein
MVRLFNLVDIIHYLTVIPSLQIRIECNCNGGANYYFDMQRAEPYGMDAFALSEFSRPTSLNLSLIYVLDISVDPYTDAQLNYAYDSATNNGMKVRFHTKTLIYPVEMNTPARCSSRLTSTGRNTGQATQIGQLVATYGVNPRTAQNRRVR